MPLADFISSLKENQFFGAGFGLVGVGAFLAIARKGSQYALSFFQRYGLTTLEITSRDKSYQWLLHWINAQGQRTQHLSVQTAFYQVCFVTFVNLVHFVERVCVFVYCISFMYLSWLIFIVLLLVVCFFSLMLCACMLNSDCNSGIEFSIPGFGIDKFMIPGSSFGIRLTEWSLFCYP